MCQKCGAHNGIVPIDDKDMAYLCSKCEHLNNPKPQSLRPEKQSEKKEPAKEIDTAGKDETKKMEEVDINRETQQTEDVEEKSTDDSEGELDVEAEDEKNSASTNEDEVVESREEAGEEAKEKRKAKADSEGTNEPSSESETVTNSPD